MDETKKDSTQELRHNTHGIATALGVLVCIVFGLVTRNDLLFGLVMATVYGSGLNAGKKIAQALSQQGQGNFLPAKIIAAIVVGIIAALIISVIQGLVDVSPMADDHFLVTIIKHFFDSYAALAVGAGALVGSILHGMSEE